MKKFILFFTVLIIYTNLIAQSQEILRSLTHTSGPLVVTVWNDGFLGPHFEPEKNGSIAWKGVNGTAGSGFAFGTQANASANGMAKSGGTWFIDVRNVNSNFAGGFTEESVGTVTFDKVSTAVISDSNATNPYRINIIHKTYSKTGENVLFSRYGYVNSIGRAIIDLYSSIGSDWDVGDIDANTGVVDTSANLAYIYEPGTSNPYFGLAAMNGLSGGKIWDTHYGSVPQLRDSLFSFISTIDQSDPGRGDQVCHVGSYIEKIAMGDTAWVTFALLAGDDLEGLRNNTARAFEIAYDAGWTDKLIPGYSRDQLINVPGDQPTIQSAIDASVDGDTVLVADGTYFENINFKGKAITVASHFLIDGDETHTDNTIINGSQPSHPDSGSVVSFISGEDITSVLCGFTITGGTGIISPPNSGYDAFGGGGIAVSRGGGKIHFNKITNNSISYNNLAAGGGIIIDSPVNRVVVENNYITNNKLFSQNGVGGGIMCTNSRPETILIAGNIISDNQSYNGQGGGMYIDDASVEIRNNLIKNNISANGIKIINHPDPGSYKMIFSNNTVVNNEGEGLSSYSPVSTPKISNSIFWGNNSALSQIEQELGHVSVSYSNIEGSFIGTGNMDQDPLFENTINYYLSSSSPCIDAGNPDPQYNDDEDPENLGYPLPPALGELRNDLGYCGGKLLLTDVEVITVEAGLLPDEFELYQNYPNPFNPTTIINYSIPKGSIVTVKVFDVLGKEVSTLVNERHKVGHYQVELNANKLSSGVYFYTLRTEDFIQTKKMILLR